MTGASRVVVTGWVPEPALEAISGAGHEVHTWDGAAAVPRRELLRMVRGAHGLVTLVTERVDAELLDAAGDQLAVVANVAVGYDNDPMEIGFNAKYLLDITAQLSGDDAIFMLADAGSPTLVRDTAGDDALYVLMPMRV